MSKEYKEVLKMILQGLQRGEDVSFILEGTRKNLANEYNREEILTANALQKEQNLFLVDIGYISDAQYQDMKVATNIIELGF